MGTSCEGLLLRICENHSGAIHCHKGNINIISVNYGRLTGGHICPGVVKTQNCGAAGSLGQVRRVCQGKQYCILHATNGHFGDPCHGTTKYLEVRVVQRNILLTYVFPFTLRNIKNSLCFHRVLVQIY